MGATHCLVLVVVWGLAPGVSRTQNYFNFPCTKMVCEKGFIMVLFQKEEGFFPLILFLVRQVEILMLGVASVVRRCIVAHKFHFLFCSMLSLSFGRDQIALECNLVPFPWKHGSHVL